MSKHIIIIGGGPAVVEAALTAASKRARVTLIADSPAGNWHKLLSSRLWLAALDTLVDYHRLQSDSEPTTIPASDFDLKRIARNVQQIGAEWGQQQTQQLQQLGVNILIGRATFLSPSRIGLVSPDNTTSELEADAIIIATGTEMRLPPVLAPDGKLVFTSDTIDQLASPPRSILVIGDGPVGFEFVHIFSHLNVAVTWLVLPGGPSCGIIPEANSYLINLLTQRGVNIVVGPPAKMLERHADHVVVVMPNEDRHRADCAFISFGWQSNLPTLQIDKADLATMPTGGLEVNAYGQTAVPSIYAIGDVIGPRSVTNARVQARRAALHALGQPVEPPGAADTAITFGSNPQVAKVGVLSAADGSVQSITIPLRASLKPLIASYPEGTFTLAWDPARRVVGGLAIGYQAADALTPVILAIKLGASIDDLMTLYGPHPTISELPLIAARMIPANHD